MAVKLIANYAKRLGLPGYSSHQFSVSVETELRDIANVAGESADLYAALQQAVDEQIKRTGFVPDHGYGLNADQNGAWNCSSKQHDLIEKIISEKRLDQRDIEQLATRMFGLRIEQLNKLQASGLIDELLDRYGNGKRNGFRQRRSRTGVQKEATA